MLRFGVMRIGKTIFSSVRCPCKETVHILSTKGFLKKESISNNTAPAEITSKHEELKSKILLSTDNSNIDSDQFARNKKMLLDFGFDSGVVKSFIKTYPSVFAINSDRLSDILRLWYSWGANSEILIELLSTHPQLLEVIGPSVMDRIRYLKPYFVKDNVICTLFINSPGVIYENWDALRKKLEFLHSHNIPMKKVANCNALDLSLLEMKTRFTFLERVGRYKKRTDLFQKDSKHSNPTVRNILCTNDKLFAETIAGLTLIEYEAFIDLYKFEYETFDDLDYNEEDSE